MMAVPRTRGHQNWMLGFCAKLHATASNHCEFRRDRGLHVESRASACFGHAVWGTRGFATGPSAKGGAQTRGSQAGNQARRIDEETVGLGRVGGWRTLHRCLGAGWVRQVNAGAVLLGGGPIHLFRMLLSRSSACTCARTSSSLSGSVTGCCSILWSSLSSSRYPRIISLPLEKK